MSIVAPTSIVDRNSLIVSTNFKRLSPTRCKCKICRKSFTSSRRSGRTSLLNHLQRFHKDYLLLEANSTTSRSTPTVTPIDIEMIDYLVDAGSIVQMPDVKLKELVESFVKVNMLTPGRGAIYSSNYGIEQTGSRNLFYMV